MDLLRDYEVGRDLTEGNYWVDPMTILAKGA